MTDEGPTITPDTVDIILPPSKMFFVAIGFLVIAVLAYMVFNEMRSEKLVKTVTEMRQREVEAGVTPAPSMNGHRVMEADSVRETSN